MKKGLIQFILGIIIALTGAMIIFQGSIFGERNTGIGTIIGLVGLGLIATSKYRLLKKKK